MSLQTLLNFDLRFSIVSLSFCVKERKSLGHVGLRLTVVSRSIHRTGKDGDSGVYTLSQYLANLTQRIGHKDSCVSEKLILALTILFMHVVFGTLLRVFMSVFKVFVRYE